MKLGCLSAILFFIALTVGGAFVIPVFVKGGEQNYRAGKVLGKVAAVGSIPIFFIGFAIQKRRESAG